MVSTTSDSNSSQVETLDLRVTRGNRRALKPSTILGKKPKISLSPMEALKSEHPVRLLFEKRLKALRGAEGQDKFRLVLVDLFDDFYQWAKRYPSKRLHGMTAVFFKQHLDVDANPQVKFVYDTEGLGFLHTFICFATTYLVSYEYQVSSPSLRQESPFDVFLNAIRTELEALAQREKFSLNSATKMRGVTETIYIKLFCYVYVLEHEQYPKACLSSNMIHGDKKATTLATKILLARHILATMLSIEAGIKRYHAAREGRAKQNCLEIIEKHFITLVHFASHVEVRDDEEIIKRLKTFSEQVNRTLSSDKFKPMITRLAESFELAPGTNPLDSFTETNEDDRFQRPINGLGENLGLWVPSWPEGDRFMGRVNLLRFPLFEEAPNAQLTQTDAASACPWLLDVLQRRVNASRSDYAITAIKNIAWLTPIGSEETSDDAVDQRSIDSSSSR